MSEISTVPPTKPVTRSQLTSKRDLLARKYAPELTSDSVINMKKMTDVFTRVLVDVHRENPKLPKEQKTDLALGVLREMVSRVKTEPERNHTTREIDSLDMVTENLELIEAMANSFSDVIVEGMNIAAKIKTAAKGWGCCSSSN